MKLKDILEANGGVLPRLAGGAGTNIDPHDMFASLPAGENLSEKQFFLVEITEAGEVVLAKAKARAFCLLNTPTKGQSAHIAVPLQCKGPAKEELKAGWALAAGAGGELVKAGEAAHVIGICLATTAKGALAPFASFPVGATG
jgi:hypothetical protein